MMFVSRLSIVVLGKNDPEALEGTLSSLDAQTNQSFERVVINGVSNGSASNRYAAMNQGLSEAHGEYVLFLDSGDTLIDDNIVDTFYQLSTSADIISGNTIIGNSIYDVRFSPDENELSYQFMCEHTIQHSSSFIKRELFDKFGYYDVDLHYVSEWKLLLCCLIKNNCSYAKWEKCITSVSADNDHSAPEECELIAREKEFVLSSFLPYVKRTYDHQQQQISTLSSIAYESFGNKVKNKISRGVTKINSFACLAFLHFRGELRRWLHKSSSKERIIVSFTSWKKRIDNASAVIRSILSNTVKPDLVVLNLSAQEFPGKEKDLPSDILDLVENQFVEILWEEGNSKVFKKFIPTINKYPDDVVIAIDDDFLYPSDFIASFMDMHKRYPKDIISGNNFTVCGVQGHCGCASLVKKEYFGQYINKLLDHSVVRLSMDDIFYVFCATLNGTSYRYVGKLFYTNMKQINPVDGISDNSRDIANKRMQDYMIAKIREVYHIDMSKLNKPHFCI